MFKIPLREKKSIFWFNTNYEISCHRGSFKTNLSICSYYSSVKTPGKKIKNPNNQEISNLYSYMSNEKEKIAKFKIKPQSACKRWKSKKLGKNEYWTPTLLGNKKIETMDMETGFIEEEFQEGEEEFQDDEPLTLINAQSKGHFS